MNYANTDLARRTEAQIVFAGTDITTDIRPHLLSVDYTDNEEDETDDLQIKLHDIDSIWLQKWLNDAVQSAAVQKTAAASAAQSSSGTTVYQVTPAIGLNVRAGPGTGYAKLGAYTCGTMINVSSISNGWATIQYSGRTAYVCAQYIKYVGASGASSSGSSASSSKPVSGMKIQAVIVQRNWYGDGKDKLLDCGEFELDSIKAGGPPAAVTIKGTSLPYASAARQTVKSKSWEAYYLSGIAKEIASNAGMGCMYLADVNPYYTHKEQYKVSDIAFLSSLCKDAGISLKVTNGILVLFEQSAYERKGSAITIKPGDGSYTKYSFSVGKADTEYQSCRVRYTDPATGRCFSGIAYIEDYKESDKNQQLEITAKVASAAEAKALAAARLRLHNKYMRSASFTLVGNVDAVAGVNVTLSGWGMFDGKYVIKRAKHSVGGSGYTTTIDLRLALEV